ncbi:hypothetical protein QTP86_025323 [Hemibagrus guttatus]|nr:hypothetical protein QTP86_025323 [Hemibagrus guttatus]
MNRSFNNKAQTLRHSDLDAVEVKSKYGAEFRRFSVNRAKPGKFEEFFKLIINLHRIANMEVMIGYADVHGDLLPINNDDNFCKAVSTAHPLLRIFIQRQVATDSQPPNTQDKIKTQTCRCKAPCRGLPLRPACYRAPVLACDGPGGRMHVKDLWVMTNHRPDLVFLHVHPVGKSGRTGEQAHEAGHKVCRASLNLPKPTRFINKREPIITHRQSDCDNNGQLIILAKADKSAVLHFKHGSWCNFRCSAARNIFTEEIDYSTFGTNTLTRKKKAGVALRNDLNRKRPHIRIGLPQDFRPVSSIIDVDIVPESHRRVRLYRHGSHKPLGFYIRDGTSVRVTAHGLEKVPGIFISRLVPGGLAEGTGLLAVNDEVLEVNGIEVTGKTLDQVTDMMIANSHNLIVTVKPANQRNNVVRASRVSGSSGQSSDSSSSSGITSLQSLPSSMPAVSSSYAHDDLDSDEESDIVIENSIGRQTRHSNASLASLTSRTTQLTSASPPKPQSRPLSVVSTASFHSNVSLNGTGHNSLSYRLHRDLNLHHTAYNGVRESNGSLHKILSSLRTDPRNSLALPSGAVEEDGMVITL